MALARSSRDIVYTVWDEGPAGKRNVFISRKASDGRLIGFPSRVNGSRPIAEINDGSDLRIAVSGTKNVAVMWPEAFAGHIVFNIALSHDAGQTFRSFPIIEASQASAIGSADLTEGSVGTVHLILEERNGNRASRIIYETFHDRQRQTLARALATGGVSDPAISLGPDGKTIAAAWLDGKSRFLRVEARISRDGGRTFGPTLDVGPAGDAVNRRDSTGPSVVVSSSNRVFVAWTEWRPESSDAHIARLNGGTFEVQSGFPSGDPSSDPAIACETDGSLQIAWEEGQNPHSRIRIVSLDPRGAFGVARTVAASFVVRFPSVAATAGAAYVGWQEGVGVNAKIHTARISNLLKLLENRPTQEQPWPPSSPPSTPLPSKGSLSTRRSG